MHRPRARRWPAVVVRRSSATPRTGLAIRAVGDRPRRGRRCSASRPASCRSSRGSAARWSPAWPASRWRRWWCRRTPTCCCCSPSRGSPPPSSAAWCRSRSRSAPASASGWARSGCATTSSTPTASCSRARPRCSRSARSSSCSPCGRQWIFKGIREDEDTGVIGRGRRRATRALARAIDPVEAYRLAAGRGRRPAAASARSAALARRVVRVAAAASSRRRLPGAAVHRRLLDAARQPHAGLRAGAAELRGARRLARARSRSPRAPSSPSAAPAPPSAPTRSACRSRCRSSAACCCRSRCRSSSACPRCGCGACTWPSPPWPSGSPPSGPSCPASTARNPVQPARRRSTATRPATTSSSSSRWRAFALAWRIAATRVGRSFSAIRDSETVAAAYGIRPVRVKLTGFVVSGAIAALAGTMLAYQLGARAAPQYASVFFSISWLANAVVGRHRARIAGPVDRRARSSASTPSSTKARGAGGVDLVLARRSSPPRCCILIMAVNPGGLASMARFVRSRASAYDERRRTSRPRGHRGGGAERTVRGGGVVMTDRSSPSATCTCASAASRALDDVDLRRRAAARSSASSAPTARARRRCSTASPASARPTRGSIVLTPRRRPVELDRAAGRGSAPGSASAARSRTPGCSSSVPIRDDPAHRAARPHAAVGLRALGARHSAAPRRRGRGGRAGRRGARARRADRPTPTSRPTELSTGMLRLAELAAVVAVRPAAGAARRAVVGHRPEGDRGPRPAAAAAARRPGRHRSCSSSTTCRWSWASPTASSPWPRARSSPTARPPRSGPTPRCCASYLGAGA